MKRQSRFHLLWFTMLFVGSTISAEVVPGKFFGAQHSEAPDWFKESFLEFEEDVAEAKAEGRRVMLYFHQEGCPYCAKLVEENFSDPSIETYVKKHFDGITINIWGDREVISFAGQSFTEKSFAEALKVQYTPTLIFLNENGKVANRLNGYYPPDQFKLALKYVAERHDKKISFATYLKSTEKSSIKKLIAEDFYQNTNQLNNLINLDKRPLAVYFETGDCKECRVMHEQILTDQTTRQLVAKMNNVQLNARSDQPIVTPDGRKNTIQQWAQDLNISYMPAVVFFDSSGNEIMRIEGFVKTFHFQSVYDYILTGAYLTHPNFQRFISERSEKIREAGFDTHIWNYESLHE